MKTIINYTLLIVVATLSIACGSKGTNNLLEEVSGVWRANIDGAMVSIIYSDKKLSMLIGDDVIPVTVGDIDNENKTINLNVTLADNGKPGVWTLRQIWDTDHKTFHLSFTLHDGTQDDLSFVRKISTDDLNRLANLKTRANPATISDAVATAPAMEPEQEEMLSPGSTEEVAATPVMESAEQATFSPSFDCAKASTGAERLICSNQELATLDVEMMSAYRRLADGNPDKIALKEEQIDWMKNERNTCSTSDCMAKAYRSRIEDMESAEQYLSKPAVYR